MAFAKELLVASDIILSGRRDRKTVATLDFVNVAGAYLTLQVLQGVGEKEHDG